MIDYVDEIAGLMAPPARPVANQGDWEAVFTAIGTALPTDYVRFIRRYGAGNINRELIIYHPFVAPHLANIDRPYASIANSRMSEMATIRRENEGMYGEMPLYPEPTGALIWGHSVDGWEVFWRTSGPPDDWTAMVLVEGYEWIECDLSFSGFILGVLRHSLPGVRTSHIEPIFDNLTAGGAR